MKLCGKTLGWWDQSAGLVRTDFAGSISSDCAWGETPFARAVFMMFLVSEVHPFVDGNGRIARIMMSAELAAAGEERIIVPTAYRSNYLTALKPPSQSGQPTPIVRTLDFTRKWGRRCPGPIWNPRAAF